MNNPSLSKIISIITSPELQEELLSVKIVFLFFSFIFLTATIFFYIISSYLKHQTWADISGFFGWKPYGLRKIIKRWEKIQKRVQIGTESEYKLAIIEADDFLNDVLEERGFEGTTLEERIKQVEDFQVPNVQEILEAHQIRNSIVYDPDYRLEPERAKKILEIYERNIKNIESF